MVSPSPVPDSALTQSGVPFLRYAHHLAVQRSLSPSHDALIFLFLRVETNPRRALP